MHFWPQTAAFDADAASDGEKDLALHSPTFPMEKSFRIPKLKSTLSTTVLSTEIPARFRQMPENEALYRPLLERLEFVHPDVAKAPAESAARRQFVDVLVRLLRILKGKELLTRLAKCELLVQMLVDLHERVDNIVQELELNEETTWRQQWEEGCLQQQRQLLELVPNRPTRKLVNDIEDDKKLNELLLALLVAVDTNQESTAMVALKQQTHERITAYIQRVGLPAFDWFVPREHVDFDDEAIGFGTFGTPKRGTWVHDGERHQVVVKELFPELPDTSEKDFVHQLQIWYKLPQHENVLKLYGGCHVNTPPFFVCEKAENGSLGDFLREEGHASLLWPMFLQLAKGIQFLHEHNIVHGGIKCNNALVTSNGVVKLADFNCCRIRTLSQGLSEYGAKAQSLSVRWKPREVLEQVGEADPLPESDIFSLGMSIIEAFTQEPPYGFVLDSEAAELIRSGVLPERPEGLPNAQWEFIERLCAEKVTERPTIAQAIETLSRFAEVAEGG